jgi:Flp pilus assembly protein TadB
MKTYIFIFILIGMMPFSSWAAQDQSLAEMNVGNFEAYTLAISQLEAVQKQSSHAFSWKEKMVFKIAKRKLLKAERKVKQGKKANSLVGGLVVLLVIGVVLIPLGILFLVPLIVIGVILLALGIVGSIFRGLGSIFW